MRLIYIVCFLVALLTGCGQTAAAEAQDQAPPADEPVSPPETEYVRQDGDLRLAQEWRVGDGEILTDNLVAQEYLALVRPKPENQFG